MSGRSKYPQYEMYTPAGDYAVHRMVQKCCRVIQNQTRKIKARRQAIKFIEAEMQRVAQKHGEIWDTEPHWAVCDGTAEAFRAREWQPYSRWDD